MLPAHCSICATASVLYLCLLEQHQPAVLAQRPDGEDVPANMHACMRASKHHDLGDL